jgi:hypothetical protein
MYFSEPDMVAWRTKYVPGSNPDAWIGWQKLSAESRSPNLLCQQCGWPWIPYSRGNFLWRDDSTPCACDGFCPNLACPLGLTGGTPPPDIALAERAARLAEPYDRQSTPLASLRSFPGVPLPSEQRPAPSHDDKRAAGTCAGPADVRTRLPRPERQGAADSRRRAGRGRAASAHASAADSIPAGAAAGSSAHEPSIAQAQGQS